MLYPGVREALDRMHGEGAKLAILTNKPVRISQVIVDGLGLHDHFFRVYGGNSFEQKKPNPAGIYKLMEEAGTKDAGPYADGRRQRCRRPHRPQRRDPGGRADLRISSPNRWSKTHRTTWWIAWKMWRTSSAPPEKGDRTE